MYTMSHVIVHTCRIVGRTIQTFIYPQMKTVKCSYRISRKAGVNYGNARCGALLTGQEEEGFNYRSIGKGGTLVQRLVIDIVLMMKAYKHHFLNESSPQMTTFTNSAKIIKMHP